MVGGSNGTTELASAEIYDRYSQSFSIAATQMSVGRQGHSAVLLPDNGGVLVAGGTSNGVTQTSVDLFLPAVFPDPFSYGEGEFTATGAMTAARAGAVAGPTSVEGYAFAAGGGSAAAEVYRFATIKTDKDDYAPGELATITGSGWQANEEVTLLFQEDPAVHDDYVVKVTCGRQRKHLLEPVGAGASRHWRAVLSDCDRFAVARADDVHRRAQSRRRQRRSAVRNVDPGNTREQPPTRDRHSRKLTICGAGSNEYSALRFRTASPRASRQARSILRRIRPQEPQL